MRLTPWFAAVAIAAAIPALAQGDPGQAPGAIRAYDFGFENPETGESSVTINPGETVTFSYPTGGNFHNVVFDAVQPTSCTQTAGPNMGPVPPLPGNPRRRGMGRNVPVQHARDVRFRLPGARGHDRRRSSCTGAATPTPTATATHGDGDRHATRPRRRRPPPPPPRRPPRRRANRDRHRDATPRHRQPRRPTAAPTPTATATATATPAATTAPTVDQPPSTHPGPAASRLKVARSQKGQAVKRLDRGRARGLPGQGRRPRESHRARQEGQGHGVRGQLDQDRRRRARRRSRSSSTPPPRRLCARSASSR